MNIKALITTSLAVAGMTFFGIQKNAFADQRDFVVINDTSQTITSMYYRPVNFQNWKRILLNLKIFPSTQSQIFINEASTFCWFNIKTVYSDRSYDVTTHNLCTEGTVRYYGPGGFYGP